ncbi:hypothetical protein BMS3Bbin01_00339 [bacterium BMS3Bbin01]|nr:hypothetical protein BMS3Bbin01_00339 [bacterium BMS3Bbin01]
MATIPAIWSRHRRSAARPLSVRANTVRGVRMVGGKTEQDDHLEGGYPEEDQQKRDPAGAGPGDSRHRYCNQRDGHRHRDRPDHSEPRPMSPARSEVADSWQRDAAFDGHVVMAVADPRHVIVDRWPLLLSSGDPGREGAQRFRRRNDGTPAVSIPSAGRCGQPRLTGPPKLEAYEKPKVAFATKTGPHCRPRLQGRTRRADPGRVCNVLVPVLKWAN